MANENAITYTFVGGEIKPGINLGDIYLLDNKFIRHTYADNTSDNMSNITSYLLDGVSSVYTTVQDILIRLADVEDALKNYINKTEYDIILKGSHANIISPIPNKISNANGLVEIKAETGYYLKSIKLDDGIKCNIANNTISPVFNGPESQSVTLSDIGTAVTLVVETEKQMTITNESITGSINSPAGNCTLEYKYKVNDGSFEDTSLSWSIKDFNDVQNYVNFGDVNGNLKEASTDAKPVLYATNRTLNDKTITVNATCTGTKKSKNEEVAENQHISKEINITIPKVTLTYNANKDNITLSTASSSSEILATGETNGYDDSVNKFVWKLYNSNKIEQTGDSITNNIKISKNESNKDERVSIQGINKTNIQQTCYLTYTMNTTNNLSVTSKYIPITIPAATVSFNLDKTGAFSSSCAGQNVISIKDPSWSGYEDGISLYTWGIDNANNTTDDDYSHEFNGTNGTKDCTTLTIVPKNRTTVQKSLNVSCKLKSTNGLEIEKNVDVIIPAAVLGVSLTSSMYDENGNEVTKLGNKGKIKVVANRTADSHEYNFTSVTYKWDITDSNNVITTQNITTDTHFVEFEFNNTNTSVTPKITVKCQITSNNGNTASKSSVFTIAKNSANYYWYAGQTQPTSLTTNPTPSSEFTNNNWFEIGTTLPTVINQRVTGGISGKSWYAAMPTAAGLVAGADGVEDTSMQKISTITVNGVQYDVWDALGVTATRFTVQFYKK